ncbi:MFS transporter [Actinocatenispora thailandica]|uniref:MFS transporter n=1 Tax=Actinocatenispora thailandica TaxID=227318 RepID=A0A7R7DS46_9ACTN|nr:MFS transporter [Actinocatenispora thailandica]BCJ36731.1 MFS transporter [Actinocatenispora thailandica]
MTTTVPRTTGTGRRPYAGLALMVIITCQLMLMLDSTVVTVALPQIRTALHFSPASIAWVMDAYSLAFGGLLLLGGRIGDLYGRRRLFVAGIALFTLASLVGGLSANAGMLLAARVVQGVAAALAAPSALALIVTNFDGPARVRAIALYSSVAGAGGSVGLLLGGMLTAWVSWRWVLFINVPIGIALVVLAPLVVTEAPRHRHRLDLAGAVTATIGVGALAYGFLHAATAGWDAPATLGAFAVAVPVLVAFVLVEWRIGEPLLPLSLFADRNRTGGYVNMLVLPSAMFGVFFFVSQYLGLVAHYDALRTGLAFLPLTVLAFAAARLAPRLIQRYGAKPLMVVGALLLGSGVGWLTRLDAGDGYWTALFGPMVLLGLGVGCSFVPASATILRSVPQGDSGAASGTLQMLQQIGGALGLAALVTAYGAVAGTGTTGLAHGASAAFALGTALVAAALLNILFVIRHRHPTTA